jgi:hypothetical protein
MAGNVVGGLGENLFVQGYCSKYNVIQYQIKKRMMRIFGKRTDGYQN